MSIATDGGTGICKARPAAAAARTGPGTGDGKASENAAVTTVTSKLENYEAKGPAAGVGTTRSVCDSAIDSGDMPVTPVTLVTGTKTLKISSPVGSGDSLESGDSGHALGRPGSLALPAWQGRRELQCASADGSRLGLARPAVQVVTTGEEIRLGSCSRGWWEMAEAA